MLVLSRKTEERIHIGDNITIVVNQIKGNRVTIGIDAPSGVKILRGELQGVADQFDDRLCQNKNPARATNLPPLLAAPGNAGGMHGATDYFLPRNAR
jgi:carbon storage regulator